MAQLCRHAEDLRTVGARVVLVSFGPLPAAARWVRETSAPFPLWIDPERKAYRSYGADRSFLRSWGPRTILTYARLILAGRRWRGIQGDSSQLGGDFIVDERGIIRFAHRSHDPADRPDVDVLVRILREASAESSSS